MLELYQAEGCPYCQKVRDEMTHLGLSFVAHNPRFPGDIGGDVTNEQTHRQMLDVGGQDQIPFLVDHHRGETLYESDDIVNYLQEHYG